MAAEQQRPPVAPYIVYHAFRPQIAVYSAPDVDELAAANGLRNLAQLLKPWEASVERVTLRTSTFASHVVPVFPLLIDDARDLVHTELDALFLDSLSESITKRVPEWLAPMDPIDVHDDSDEDLWKEGTIDELTPWYGYYRETLVNLRPRTEYETFGHPVACILAVSTSNPEPLNAFAELYDATSPEKLFADKPWVDPNVLRYYVLVHDATIGPAEDFVPLLEDVRRAYGLHTNLLILNAEAAPKPDSAYIDASQRPLPKPADFQSHWTNLPTSPTLPHFETGPTPSQASQPPKKATPAPVEPGAKLGQEDVRRIKLFLREFVVQNLAPWLERTTTQLNEQLAANRKGIAGRLFSAGRRYFGSRPASPAPGSATSASAFDPIKGFYRYTTQEAQTRKLADFALMIADYRLAAANYEIARKDFLHDKAWRYYSSATRMAGLLNLLLRKVPSGPVMHTEHDPYLEEAARAPIAGSAQLDGLRTIALYYELYQEQEDWRAAALGLAKFASDIDELPSALMLEQAAMVMLRLHHPARRRFALLMTIAAHRYQKTGPKSLADRCGRQALTLFSDLDHKDWIDFRNHLELMLGQQAFNDGKADIALMHFLRNLVKKSEADNSSESRDFLDDIELAWARLGTDADDMAKSSGLCLPEKVFDIKRTAIHAEVFNPAAIRSDSDAWLSLEQSFIEVGFPYTPAGSTVAIKRPHSLLDNATSNVVLIGETFTVELWARTDLGVPVSLGDINLTFESRELNGNGRDLVCDGSHERTLLHNTVTKVSVKVKACTEGAFTLKAVQFRYNGSITCTEDLTRKGARLHATKAHMHEPTYAEDTTLQILVKPPQPILRVLCEETLDDVYAGEVVNLQLWIENAGSRSLRDLRVLCGNPQVAFGRSTDVAAFATGSFEIDNSMQLWRPSPVDLPDHCLESGQRSQWHMTLRGDALGRTKLRWLFVFREDEGDTGQASAQLYTACYSQEINVIPSLTIHSDIVMRQADDFVLSVHSANEDLPEEVDLVGVATVSHAWQLKANQPLASQSLFPDQAVHFEVAAERVASSEDPHKLLAPTLSQLDALLQGRELADKLVMDVKMIFSPTDSESVICTSEQIFASRTASRYNSLKRQYPSLDIQTIAKVFPMYLPSTLDVVIFWRLPNSRRQGWHYMADLTASPAVNVVRELLHKASKSLGGGRYEESAQERTGLMECLQISDLAKSACPIAVRQTPSVTQSGPTGHKRTSQCLFQIINTGFEAVSCTLELLSNIHGLTKAPAAPVRWVGRLVFRCKLEPGKSINWVGSYISPTTVANQGAWVLSVTNDADIWQVTGPESLIGI